VQVRPKSYRFLQRDVGAILSAAGLPAGWTRWKAGPEAEKPAPFPPDSKLMLTL